MTAWIETSAGGRLTLEDTTFCILDQAAALSKLCRFIGRTRHFYCVAEHAVLVARLMQDHGKGNPYEGLLHDNDEASLHDLPAPFAPLFPDYAAAKRKVELANRRYYGLPEHKTGECQWADTVALFIEAYWLMPGRGANYEDPLGIREFALSVADRYRPRCLPPSRAETEFLWLYEDLVP